MVREGSVSKKRRMKGHFSDKIFDTVNLLIMLMLLVIFVYPLYFVLIASFSDPGAVWAGKVMWWPQGFTLKSYEVTFEYKELWIGYRNTIFYTVAGTLINMVMTILCAYPLSRKDWYPRKFFLRFCIITMYFGGGLIPVYLVVKSLGLLDTVWAMMIPGALSFYNALIVRNYFMNSIPESLEDAAEIDGANAAQYLVKILLPLSKPVLAVVTLYYAVGHWNDWYSALIYIFNDNLIPLQTALRRILNATMAALNKGAGNMSADDMMLLTEKIMYGMSMKYSAIILALIPMLIVYPFVQKYFVKGTMIGAIKG